MTDKRNDNTSGGSRREKLTGFTNWPQWSDLTRTILIKKDVWSLVETGPRPNLAIIWEQKTKKNRIAIRTLTRIIKKGVNNDIFNNIINITDLKEMWEKLCAACSQVGQGVVYSILQELLNYPRNNKSKGFKKPVMNIFADVCFLIKRLRAAIIPKWDIWDIIAIVVALDSLHNNFETTTTSILEQGDKTIDEIQQILASVKAKFISKRATKVTGDLAMMFRRRNSERQKASSDNKCYNYQKYGHFGRDCKLPDQRTPDQRQPKQQYPQQWKRQRIDESNKR